MLMAQAGLNSVTTGERMPLPQKAANDNRRRFLLLFANFGGNLGDLFILEQTLRWLRSRFPGCDCHVSPLADRRSVSLESSVVERYAGVAMVSPFGPSLPDVWRRAGERWPVALRALSPAVRFATAREARDSGLWDLGDKADAVLSIGGGHWGGAYKSLAMLSALEGIAAFADKTLMLPHSMPRSVPRPVAKRLPTVLNRLSQCFFRDPQSLATALHYGVRTATLVPDSAYLDLPASPPRRSPSATPTVAICLRNNTAGLKELGWQPFARAIAELRRAGTRLVCFTTHDRDDREVWERFVAEPGVEGVAIDSLDQLFQLFRNADVVVGDRLHALILATLMGTPVLPVLSLPKVAGFARHAGIPGAVSRFPDLSWAAHVEPALKDWETRQRDLLAYASASHQHLTRSLTEAGPLAKLVVEHR